ncbi:hypothetical protein ASPZODRAFT_153024 [Penicilliopsis zonata CBS 506.65]|uniref:proline dehydrogenase n=1 Tax=Penicilliopsis zonata CBS 506.65 TaxID=1073090 RepID=A0A1L9SE29_9EURO|nr:hypothetical protein ASPZODRAFT_153024 [Penicilliopsis zonata CBS 506.65]OJJ45363.1 hypothetical protein ASPZODRAFT_153024 [Penicilliopsis zonata CBS 506.65]
MRPLRPRALPASFPRRYVSGTESRPSLTTAPTTTNLLQMSSPKQEKKPASSPLAQLPLSSILRSLVILSVSSSTLLLKPCIYTLSVLANPQTPLLDVARNPLLNFLVKHTIYKQFNAGENKREVQRSIREIKNLGYKGVLLGYAREVLVGEKQADPLDDKAGSHDINLWLEGTLQTVDMAQEGDFVALKLTGMGNQALALLQQQAPPSAAMDAAIQKVCDLAISRNVRLLVDAEEQAVQPGIEAWTMKYQKYCNAPGQAIFYSTYQAYLRSTPATLARHLETSRQEGYTLGVKLVRGAYLKTEPRQLIWAEKEDTDKCYDGVIEALLTRKYNAMLPSANPDHATSLPPVNVIVATHNRDSVRKAHTLRVQQALQQGETSAEDPHLGVSLSYAQLQGMADEVSGELLEGFQEAAESVSPATAAAAAATLQTPHVYKLLTWGSVKECMGFLFRRAVENTEAVGRTKQSQEAMLAELKRRASAAEVSRTLRQMSSAQCRDLLSTLSTTLATMSSQQDTTPASERLVQQPLRSSIATKHKDVALFMPVSNSEITGIKNVFIPHRGGATLATLNIFSAEGELLGLVGATELTAFRTALATMTLFDRCKCTSTPLSRENILVFGAGRQAEWHARLALLLSSPGQIKRIVFVNRGRTRLDEMEAGGLNALRALYPGVILDTLARDDATNYEDRLQAELAACDVIFSCTPSVEPNFSYPSLQPVGQKQRFISLIGSYQPHMQEVDTDTLLSGGGTVYVDSREACLEESGELIRAKVSGGQLVELGELFDSLGEDGLLAVPAGCNVVFKCVGMGIMDLVIGRKIMQLASEQGVGSHVDF